MLKLLGCSRLTGLRLTSAMALPFCRQAPPSARNPQVQHDELYLPFLREGTCDFTLALKKACHCEDERSEDVAIAKSLNINEITTQSTIARNDYNRHPELVSGSQTDGVSRLVPYFNKNSMF